MTEREREALMRLTMCARNECVMCKYKDSCDSDVRFEFATKHMNVLADALRKTESNSEKPNNYCDDCLYTDTCDSKEFFYACTSKATISKMEQVDEPITQTETQNSNLTFEKDECAKEYEELGLKELKELIKADRKDEPTISKMEQVDKDINVRSKDEPQTDCAWK